MAKSFLPRFGWPYGPQEKGYEVDLRKGPWGTISGLLERALASGWFGSPDLTKGLSRSNPGAFFESRREAAPRRKFKKRS